MTPQRWQKITEILSHATVLTKPVRLEYLNEVCLGDRPLQAEVESLLERHDDQRGPLAAFDSLTGQCLLHYQLLEQIGRGAVGVVYKARDAHLERYVVIKVLPPLLMADEQSRRRFEREAKCLSALNHPNIVGLYDLAQDKGLNFIVMEYVPGRVLSDTIRPDGLETSLYLDYATQIAEGLAKAHSAGIIHRDLKPSNILISQDGLIKILDFGLAKDVTQPPKPTDDLTQVGSILGTVGYMSPEQVRGAPTDVRSDVFSLGAILYEMAAGVPAFKAGSPVESMAAVLNAEPAPLPKRVSSSVRCLVDRCMRKNPGDRFQSMQDVLSHMRSAGTQQARPGQPRRRAGKQARTQNWVLAFTAVAIIAALLQGTGWRFQRAAQHVRADTGGPQQVQSNGAPQPMQSNHTVVLLAPFGGDAGEWVTNTIAQSIRASTKKDSDIEIRSLSKPLQAEADAQTLRKEDTKASLVAWGETKRSTQNTLVTSHVAVLDSDPGFIVRHQVNTRTFAVTGNDPSVIQERIASELRYLTFLIAGVKRFRTRDLDSSIRALTRVVEDSPNEIVDAGVGRFYRGLAYVASIDDRHCLKTGSTCGFESTLKDLQQSVGDFDSVLRTRPFHVGAHWNRGLAYAKICQLENDAKQPSQPACESAIADFGEALRPAGQATDVNDGFFRQLPDEAGVLFNRGYTHLLEARSTNLPQPLRSAQYDAAIAAFDQILTGGSRYATFLNKRRQDVIEHRQAAERERSQLSGRVGQ